MTITEAILKVKPKIQERKLAERKKKRLEIQKQKKEEEEEYQESKRMLSLLKKKWNPIKNEVLKDKELMKGVKFLESQGKHFKLVGSNRWTVYLGSDGKFRMQRWGWYMGSNFIRKITLDNVHFISKKDIDKVVKMDLKKEVEKQVLEVG